MNFGFWNINKRGLGSLLLDFAHEFDLDILILAESPYSPSEILLLLNKDKSDFFYAPNIVCEKLQFFSKLKQQFIEPVQETIRISARKLFSVKHNEITLIAVHYNSKVNWSNEDQSAHIPKFKDLIDEVESKVGHKRTVICGDFNMNPFDVGMVQSTGLHSVMEKRIARKINRVVDSMQYDYFYNPMWGFLGDLGRGSTSGTMYYSPAKPINFHWNLFDQVLVRPDLLDDFDDSFVDIVTKIGRVDLLNNNGYLERKFSDHLPIIFKLHI